MAHPNETLLRNGYEAFEKGDLDTLRGLFTEDIVWHSPGKGLLAGEYQGIDKVFGLFAKVVELSGGTYRNDLHDVLANDEHAVALITAHAERQGKKLDSLQSHVFHVSDGKVTEVWLEAVDLYANDEFWS
jgi:ketosteroid isomerase-like protein